MTKQKTNSIIYDDVFFDGNFTIEDFCIIGIPTSGRKSKKTLIGKNSLIRSGTYIYSGNVIGDNFNTGNKVNIRESNKIGNNVSIGTNTCIEHNVMIGNNVRIHSNAFIPEFSQLKDGCWIGPNVVLTNAKYPNEPDTKENLAGPIIGKGSVIGANVTILPGVSVGNNTLIGAGSVVTKDTNDNEILIGNPAKKISNRE